MTRVVDMQAAIGLILDRVSTPEENLRIADAFVFADPYHFGNWTTTTYALQSAVIDNGGSGYAVDDILTLIGGTGTAATLRVLEEIAGVITEVIIETVGDYTVAADATVALTGGSGDGLATAAVTVIDVVKPRLPTNEEKAILLADSLKKYGQGWLRHHAEFLKREADTPAFEEAIDAAGDAAVEDMT